MTDGTVNRTWQNLSVRDADDAQADQESIGVVVVAYRSARTIGPAIKSILTDPAISNVVVHDNSRDPRTRDIVSGIADERIIYVASPNVGFAAACNAGAGMAGHPEWLAFVNPDVQLFRPLSALIDKAQTVGATLVGAEVAANGVSDVLSARVAATPVRELLKAAIGSRAYDLTRDAFGDEPRQVGQICGALQVIRRRDFDRIGGFDERFEMYYEDVDMSVRCAELGGCWFVPDVWGYHVGGESARSESEKVYRVNRISRLRFLRKHYAGGVTWFMIPLIIVLELIARTLTRQSEGNRVRLVAILDQCRELIRPGSVRLLRS